MREKGRFIVLEGIDGSGTTTQLPRIVEHLNSSRRKAIGTREPSTGPIGKLLREFLLGNHVMRNGEGVNGNTMALMFAADRYDHLQREVMPAINAGIDVVSDRFLLSSLAYQVEEKAGLEWLTSLSKDVPYPDLTILFDVDVGVAAVRRLKAGRPVERYDADSYLTKVAKNYKDLIRGYPGGMVIDASLPIDEVTTVLKGVVDAFIDSGLWGRVA